MTSDVAAAEVVDTAAVARGKDAKTSAVDAELVGKLVEQARASGLQLSGEGGLLAQLTKMVVESALEGRLASKWVNRFRRHGEVGLLDRSCAGCSGFVHQAGYACAGPLPATAVPIACIPVRMEFMPGLDVQPIWP
ncbi:hypothetical protein [Nocardia puris]|uniref:hypothetical protein n=1 Tax=Nocardia puris TaxID=208602 RepID=UPI002E1EB85E